MGKPFLTIEQQVSLLESRGISTDQDTPRILCREGYYSIVNGYKDSFIDQAATSLAGDDRFLPDTKFSDMYALFEFDRALRELTFHYLIRAESTIRTAVAYCFSNEHREKNAYLLQDSYCTRAEYTSIARRTKTDYASEVSGLITVLSRTMQRSNAGFIKHYREAQGDVPLWVLCNGLTFGNIEHMFNLMKSNEKIAVCKMVARSTGRSGGKLGYLDVSTMTIALEALVKFRNICAHDERLYCALVGGRKQINYARMVKYLEWFLTREEFDEYISRLVDELDESIKRNEKVASVIEPLGFAELSSSLKNRQIEEKDNQK